MFKLCFYQRLALSLVAVFVILVTLFFWSTNYFQTLTRSEAQQRLHIGLAEHLVKANPILSDEKLDASAVNQLFDDLMMLGPSFEFYYLDSAGNILHNSAELGQLKRAEVSLVPIQQLLKESHALPVFGDDPQNIKGAKIFSAAPVVRHEEIQGYLYIILGGEAYDSILSTLQRSQSMREFVIFACTCLIFLLIVLLVLFKYFTRPLRQLSDDMDKFRAAGFNFDNASIDLRHWNSDSQSEVQKLGCAFRELLGHIHNQFELLQETNTQRRVLLADLSHDLRTPLANLQGYIETLALNGERLSPDDRKRFVDITLKNAKNLKKLIDQIFELAYLDSGQVTIHNEAFPVAELIHDVTAKYSANAQHKSIELMVNASHFDLRVCADISKLERVLSNLLDNAIRHTGRGGMIQVGVTSVGDFIRVEVQDSGIGIKREELPFIFEARYQAENSEKDNLIHAGLGLAISQRLMLLLGSELTVESDLGKGSCFAFELRAQKAS